MVKNLIELPGISNAREIAAYPAGGGYVKKGILLRTGALNAASPKAIEQLSEKYHVQKIIDFRMSNERLKAPDPEIPGAENISLPVVEIEDYMAKLGDPELVKQYLSQKMDRETLVGLAYKNGLIGPETYELFLLGDRGQKAYKSFFQILLEAEPQNGAILWHCTDGKDRAGLASALLLAALGASRESIFEDYLLTNEANASVIEKAREKYASKGVSPEMLEVMIFAAGGAVEKYLTRVFEVLEKQFGGVNGYLSEALGLGREEISLLREKYNSNC